MKKSTGDAWALLHISTSIDAHALSRFELGRSLYLGRIQNNKWRRRPESMTGYLKFIATCYPSMSLRSYTRHYRVYERLIVESKLNIFKLKNIDFNMLVTVAECEILSPWQRWHILERVHAYIVNGWSKKTIRRKLWEYIAEKRYLNPRLKDLNLPTDEETVAQIFKTEKKRKKRKLINVPKLSHSRHLFLHA